MGSGNEFQRVIWAIEDRFHEEGLLSKNKHIAEKTGFTRSRVDDILAKLVGSNEVFVVYNAPGDPNVYITKEMRNSLTAKASEPEWIEEYEFEEKSELMEEVKDANDRISEIQTIERLLYGTGDLLEESVEYALRFLGFDPSKTEAYEDFCIERGDEVYVIEVKGVKDKIEKEDVDQLGDWLHKKIDEGVLAENLTGLLLYNHQLHVDPAERETPMTSSAEQFLAHQRSKHLQTKTLFDLVKRVEKGEIDKSEARHGVLEGDGT